MVEFARQMPRDHTMYNLSQCSNLRQHDETLKKRLQKAPHQMFDSEIVSVKNLESQEHRKMLKEAYDKPD